MSSEKLTHAAADEIFEELLRKGGQWHLAEINRRACQERKTPLAILIQYGDPRKTETK